MSIKNSIRLCIMFTTFFVGSNADSLYYAKEYSLLNDVSEFHDACIRKDLKYLNGSLHNDFTLTHFDGVTIGKDQFIAHIERRPNDIMVEFFYLKRARVTLNGNQATVTGIEVDKLRFADGMEVMHAFDSTNTYEKQDGVWQLISTKLSKP